jgi:hypothetical protein
VEHRVQEFETLSGMVVKTIRAGKNRAQEAHYHDLFASRKLESSLESSMGTIVTVVDYLGSSLQRQRETILRSASWIGIQKAERRTEIINVGGKSELGDPNRKWLITAALFDLPIHFQIHEFRQSR